MGLALTASPANYASGQPALQESCSKTVITLGSTAELLLRVQSALV
jgi:hypothetical protein